jgi:predicted double-glycine peptidase
MLKFRLWLEQQIPKDAIKVALPKGIMQRAGACGAQAFRAICLYFNAGPENEKEFMNLLGTNKDGTTPENIIKCAKKLGFQAEAKTGMKISELIGYLPVLCAMQAWGKPEIYRKNKSGHYVVAIGYDNNNIYFEDSSITNERGFLRHDEFLKRWHDIDAHGHQCNQLGIAIWMKTPHPDKKLNKAKHID